MRVRYAAMTTPPAGERMAGSTRSPFRAGWGRTLEQLEREADLLHAREVVIEGRWRPEDIRQDGGLRTGGRTRPPGGPQVIVRIIGGADDGRDLVYPAGHFDDWQDNVRAAMLVANAQRRMAAYGVGSGREQYHGFAELPSPDAVRVEHGRALIAAAGGRREAIKRHHPDVGGDPDDAAAITAAIAAGAG